MQFELLIYHCLCGLEALHSNHISHNDIRPANIYYSVSKHAYVIGGFGYAVKHLSYDEGANQISGVSYYLSPEAKRAMH
jgi:serine/threonine protein kinase